MKSVRHAVVAMLLICLLSGASVGMDATVEANLVNLADPAVYFSAEDSGFAQYSFSSHAPVEIQGVTVSVPIPDGIDITKGVMAGINFFFFDAGDERVLECSFRPEVEEMLDDGEPMNAKRLLLAEIVEANNAIRESAENIGDTQRLDDTPIVSMVQNTRNSTLLHARDASSDPAGERGTMKSLYEGFIVVDGKCIPVAANGHKNSHGFDSGGFYLAWLNALLAANGGL